MRKLSRAGKLKKVREEFAKEGYKLLSDEYVDNRTYLEFECPKGHKHKTSWASWQKGSRCFLCAKERNTGRLNLNTATMYKDRWSNIDACFYVVRVYNKESNEDFIKIGVTTKDLKTRFSSIPSKYSLELLHTLKTSLYNAVIIEDKLLKYFEEYQYIPKREFAGYTECLGKLV